MTKEKTLKDIHMEEYLRLMIKHEAIKWIKVRRQIKQPFTESSFMVFLNLTEEDLK